MTSFSFDLDDAYSEFKLIAIMTWPFDAQARTDYLVTQGAEILDFIEDEGANCLGLDQFLGVIDYNESVDSLRHDVDLNLYAAHGGRRRLKNTAGICAINKSAEEQGQRFGSACGELLAYVAVMAEHHVELGPSLSRAMRIQEKFAAEQKRYLPGSNGGTP